MLNISTINIFNTDFADCTLSEACNIIEEAVERKKAFNYFAVQDVGLTVRSIEDEFLNGFYRHIPSAIFVDGKGIIYLSYLVGKRFKEMIGGPRLFDELLRRGTQKHYNFYFLGGEQDILAKAITNIKEQYPTIRLVGIRNGFFDDLEEESIVRDINKSNCDILFLGMSTPRREEFVSKNISNFKNFVCVPVGGVFDVVAGKTRLAPKILSVLGLEWSFRVLQEPKRLAGRYFYTHSKIFLYFIKEILK